MKNNVDIKLLYIDLFCGAGGTTTGVETHMAAALCESLAKELKTNVY